LNRIKPHIDPKLQINQIGFVLEQDVQQVLTLRRLIESIKATTAV